VKTGIANLPLHSGKAPPWLFKRMVKLSRAIADAIIYEYSQAEFMKRLSNPYWFQAFACVLGFDWHSSGTTTTTCGALKLALSPELHGIIVAGGKGKASKNAPKEIMCAPFNFTDAERNKLIYASRMAAKVDNNLVQDGFQLYHHSFFISEKGEWAVIQQGMNGETARRYHWLSDKVVSFVEEPQAAICCDQRLESVLDLTAKESGETRRVSVDLVNDNPEHLKKYLCGQTTLASYSGEEKTLVMPKHHEVRGLDISERGWKALINAYELQPKNYEELVALDGIGAKSLRALALLSDLLYSAEASWKDPVKYSYAHGGKDGFPYPVDKQTYDASIEFLEDAVKAAKLDDKERYWALKRLHELI